MFEVFTKPSLKLIVGGAVKLVLRHLCRQGHLGVTAHGMLRIMRRTKETREYSPAIPLIFLTVQTLASTTCGSARTSFERWAIENENTIHLPPKGAPYNGPTLRPWDSPGLWKFATWSLASDLVAKFLSREYTPVEWKFVASIGDLFRQSEAEPWALEVMVFTLFKVLNETWFWEVLLSYVQKGLD